MDDDYTGHCCYFLEITLFKHIYFIVLNESHLKKFPSPLFYSNDFLEWPSSCYHLMMGFSPWNQLMNTNQLLVFQELFCCVGSWIRFTSTDSQTVNEKLIAAVHQAFILVSGETSVFRKVVSYSDNNMYIFSTVLILDM